MLPERLTLTESEARQWTGLSDRRWRAHKKAGNIRPLDIGNIYLVSDLRRFIMESAQRARGLTLLENDEPDTEERRTMAGDGEPSGAEGVTG